MDATSGGDRPAALGTRKLAREIAALLAIALFFSAWYAPAVFGGSIWAGEDIEAYFFSNRARHHQIAHRTGFHWWDPVPGLGQPRLANIQNGSLAPLSTLFYVFPTASVFRFYPAIALSLLGAFSYGLFRVKGAASLAAMFGALSFACMSSVATHVQHPPAIETILLWPAALLAWELYLKRAQTRFALAMGVLLAFQCFAGFPQYILYAALLTGLWVAASLWERRTDRTALLRTSAAAGAAAAIGLGLACWQLLPFAELLVRSSRSLLHAPELFADLYRASPGELLLALGAERFWWLGPTPLRYGAPYPSQPDLSVLVPCLALFGLWMKPRPWLLAAGAVVFLLGTLGSAAGVTTALGALVPFADNLRAPVRMLVPAAFLLCWLAARGLDGLQHAVRSPLGVGIALAAVLWVAGVAWSTRRAQDDYVDPDFFAVPAAVRNAQPRIASDLRRSPAGDLFQINAGLAAGVETLVVREVLVPRNFFEAWFVSQLGGLDQSELVDRTIDGLTLPFARQKAPLARAFGLRSIALFGRRGVRILPAPDPLDRFFVAPELRVLESPEARFARLADPAWDPAREAVVSRKPSHVTVSSPRAGPASDEVRVLRDEPDLQRLEVRSAGGVLVTSGLYFPGWRVWIDGEEAVPIEVNGALRGVVIAPGHYTVEWRYRPTWLPHAWVATAFSAACALALVAVTRRTRTRST